MLKGSWGQLTTSPLNNPEKVIGCELLEQKVTGLSSGRDCRLLGRTVLYDSMTTRDVAPEEQAFMAVTKPSQSSCNPCGFAS
jgi:hypothetical protein